MLRFVLIARRSGSHLRASSSAACEASPQNDKAKAVEAAQEAVKADETWHKGHYRLAVALEAQYEGGGQKLLLLRQAAKAYRSAYDASKAAGAKNEAYADNYRRVLGRAGGLGQPGKETAGVARCVWLRISLPLSLSMKQGKIGCPEGGGGCYKGGDGCFGGRDRCFRGERGACGLRCGEWHFSWLQTCLVQADRGKVQRHQDEEDAGYPMSGSEGHC